MDNKQATRLREYAADQTIHPQEREDLITGANALEFKAWLFEETGDIPRVLILRMARQKYGNDVPFLTYCEARFEESKRHG